MIMSTSTLTVFEAHLVINRAVWPDLNFMLTGHFDFQTKQQEELEKLSMLSNSNFTRDVDTENKCTPG